MKNYTNLEQSKKLAEILQIKSADMWWSRCTITDFGDGVLNVSYAVEPCNISQFRNTKEDVPAWSLAALLNVLPNDTDVVKEKADTENEKYMCTALVNDSLVTTFANNLVDVCAEMILKLNKLNQL